MEELEERLEQPDVSVGSPEALTPDQVPARRRAGARLRRSALLAAVGAFVLMVYLASPFLLVLVGWFLDPFADAVGEALVSHRVHEVTFGLLFAIALIGALAQLRHPERNVAGMQQTVIAVAAFVVVTLFTTGFEPITLGYLIPVAVAVWAHPERGQILRPKLKPHLGMLVLAAVVLLPLLAMISAELAKAVASAQGHPSHWGTMAAFAITMAALTLLAALRPVGWRVPAWTVAVGLVAYGVVSTVFPFDASARPDGWALFSVVWSVPWLAVGHLRRSARKGAGRIRMLVRLGLAVLAVPVLLVFALAWAVLRGPPRIPHQVAVNQLDRAGCLECHLEANIAETGATATPHPFEVCGDDEYDPSCIEGQTDCLACHRLAPGAVTSVELSAPRGGQPLAGHDLARLASAWRR